MGRGARAPRSALRRSPSSARTRRATRGPAARSARTARGPDRGRPARLPTAMRGRSSPAGATAPRDRGRRPGGRGRSRPPAPRSPRGGAAARALGQLRGDAFARPDDPARPHTARHSGVAKAIMLATPPAPSSTDSVAPTKPSPARTISIRYRRAPGQAPRQREEDEQVTGTATTSRNWSKVEGRRPRTPRRAPTAAPQRMPAPRNWTGSRGSAAAAAPTRAPPGSLTLSSSTGRQHRRRASPRRGGGRCPYGVSVAPADRNWLRFPH